MTDAALAGRVAIVSGGGRGLGRSFCLALARQGARVVVNNRNRVVDAGGRGPANHVADQITAAGGEAVAEYSDAADSGAGQAMVAAALGRWGRLDICVANAAIGVGGMFHKLPAEQFERGPGGQPARQHPAGPGRDGGDAPRGLRPDHPGRLHRRAARRRRPVRLRRQQGRPAGLRPVAGRRRRGQGRADQHAAAVRADPDDRRRHAVGGQEAHGAGRGGAGADRTGQPGLPG